MRLFLDHVAAIPGGRKIRLQTQCFVELPHGLVSLSLVREHEIQVVMEDGDTGARRTVLRAAGESDAALPARRQRDTEIVVDVGAYEVSALATRLVTGIL